MLLGLKPSLFMMETVSDPMEGGSYKVEVFVKSEIKEEVEDDSYNAMDFLELAECVNRQETIEFTSTDAVRDPKTGLMICMLCLEDLETSALSDHMVTIHNYRRLLFKCQNCQSTFQEREYLTSHRKECRPAKKRPYRKSIQQIMREVNSKTEGSEADVVACPLCQLALPRCSLESHLAAEHSAPEVAVACGICHRNFKSKLTLREHTRLVHEAVEDSEQCELCGQKFSSVKYLSNHRRNVHPTGDKVHECEECGKRFKSRLCLYQHRKHVHPPAAAAARCPHCPDKVFKSGINLQQHLKVAHGGR